MKKLLVTEKKKKKKVRLQQVKSFALKQIYGVEDSFI